MRFLHKMKRNISKMKQNIMKPFVLAVASVPVLASSAFAAIDLTAVQTLIDAAVADVLAVGIVLLGAFAGFWGIKKMIAIFKGN